jgi:site-specific recombinase XerD
MELATHQLVEPSEWSATAGKVIGTSESAIETNMAFDVLRKKVYDYKDRISYENRDFTVDTLREKWFGQDQNKRTLLDVFRLNIIELEKLVAKGQYRKSTLTKYQTTERHLKAFLEWRANGPDILLKDLRFEFAKNFEFFEQTEKGLSINSSGKMIKNLKKVVTDCVNKDWLEKNPFLSYKVKHVDPKIPHLTVEELKLIEEKEILIERLSLVRDMFLFSCYTGFAYIDVANLTLSHIKEGPDGKKWLVKNREKTDISERVPLLPIPISIINKYENHPKVKMDGKLLPIPSNQKINAYLKELGDICGIKTRITFHIARHTFASTITLENGVPIDSVSRMLGHRSIKTTQIYAKVSDKKICDDTKILFQRFCQ